MNRGHVPQDALRGARERRIGKLLLVALPIGAVVHQDVDALEMLVPDRLTQVLARLGKMRSTREVTQDDSIGLPHVHETRNIRHMQVFPDRCA